MKEQESDNSTAIIQKALETHSSIVNILIKNGADETIKDNKVTEWLGSAGWLAGCWITLPILHATDVGTLDQTSQRFFL